MLHNTHTDLERQVQGWCGVVAQLQSERVTEHLLTGHDRKGKL